MRNEEVFHVVLKERNTLHTVKERKSNWMGHILRSNCLLNHVFEGKIVAGEKWRRRRKQLLDDFKEKRGY